MRHRTTFLGIPVVTEQDIEDELTRDRPQIYAVQRVLDTARSGPSPELRSRRTRTPCEGCGEICWLDPKGYVQVAILHPQILCNRCIVARLKSDKAARENTEPEGDLPS